MTKPRPGYGLGGVFRVMVARVPRQTFPDRRLLDLSVFLPEAFPVLVVKIKALCIAQGINHMDSIDHWQFPNLMADAISWIAPINRALKGESG